MYTIKYQVFPKENFPRQVLSHYHTILPQQYSSDNDRKIQPHELLTLILLLDIQKEKKYNFIKERKNYISFSLSLKRKQR